VEHFQVSRDCPDWQWLPGAQGYGRAIDSTWDCDTSPGRAGELEYREGSETMTAGAQLSDLTRGGSVPDLVHVWLIVRLERRDRLH
jgi:hypothetical protein